MTKINQIMARMKKSMRKLSRDERGQGATEYILLLVVVVAIAMIFRGQITSAVQSKITEVGTQINSFGGSGGSTPP